MVYYMNIQPMQHPMKYRKKPVVIEAMQLRANNSSAVAVWCDGSIRVSMQGGVYSEYILIDTLEGTMRADMGDWIIRGVKGEFYPCKPDIFAETYTQTEGW